MTGKGKDGDGWVEAVDRFFKYRSMVCTQEPADSLSFLPASRRRMGIARLGDDATKRKGTESAIKTEIGPAERGQMRF